MSVGWLFGTCLISLIATPLVMVAIICDRTVRDYVAGGFATAGLIFFCLFAGSIFWLINVFDEHPRYDSVKTHDVMILDNLAFVVDNDEKINLNFKMGRNYKEGDKVTVKRISAGPYSGIYMDPEVYIE